MARKLKYEMKAQIEQAVSDRFAELEAVALAALVKLMRTAKSEAVRFQCARDILDRGRHMRGERRVVDRFDHMTESQLWAKLVDAMGEGGARKFMGLDYVPPSESEQRQHKAGEPNSDTVN